MLFNVFAGLPRSLQLPDEKVTQEPRGAIKRRVTATRVCRLLSATMSESGIREVRSAAVLHGDRRLTLRIREGRSRTTHELEAHMYVIREVFCCKPGMVRPLVEKFLAMNKLSERGGMPRMRVMTDFAGEQYWTLVAEMEVESLQAFESMMSGAGQNAGDAKEMEEIMKGYHDLVVSGRREVFKIEG